MATGETGRLGTSPFMAGEACTSYGSDEGGCDESRIGVSLPSLPCRERRSLQPLCLPHQWQGRGDPWVRLWVGW
ncbi:hypothetical protein ACOSQ2_026968 [Xanthoceras sorbifolium]